MRQFLSFCLIAACLFCTNASGFSSISLEELLAPDIKARARAAVDEGNSASIMSVDCDGERFIFPDYDDYDWMSSGYIMPEQSCPELLENPVYGGKVRQLEQAITDYNDAVAERAREIGAFSVYGASRSFTDSDNPAYIDWLAKGAAMLQRVAGSVSMESIETDVRVSGETIDYPARLFISGRGDVEWIEVGLDKAVWKKGPYPWDLLQAMHWRPSNRDAAYLGEIDGYPAYLLIMSDAGYAFLIVALSLNR